MNATLTRTAILNKIPWLLLLLHVLIVLWMLSPTLFGGDPPMWGDNAPNYYKALTSLRVVEETGATQGYDPQLFAGYPAGAVDTNSHGVHLLMRVLTVVLSPERAFALWIFLGLMFLPVGVAWLAALSGADQRQQLLSAALVIVPLHIDPLARHFLRFGTVPWLTSCVLVALFAALFARAIERPDRHRVLTVIALLPFLCIHVMLPIPIAVAFLIAAGVRLARSRENLGRAASVGVLVALSGLVVNLWWVLPIVENWSVHGDLSYDLVVWPHQLLLDLLSVILPSGGYLDGSHSVRFGLLALGTLGLVSLGRDGAHRSVAITLLLVVWATLAFAYFAGITSVGRSIQHHRWVLIALFGSMAFVPRGWVAFRAWSERTSIGRMAFAIAVALVVLGGALEVWRSVTLPLRPQELDDDGRAVIRYLARQNAIPEGRVLVEVLFDDSLGAAIATELERPALSFPSPGMAWPYGGVSWTHHPPIFLGTSGRPPIEDVPELMDRYAIAWVVGEANTGARTLELLPRSYFEGCIDIGHYRVCQVANPASWFLEGTGRLQAKRGKITISNLSGPVVIRFHYVPGLSALQEGVLVERFAIPNDPAGFVRIDPDSNSTVDLVLR
jgi:hypothetical protein